MARVEGSGRRDTMNEVASWSRCSSGVKERGSIGNHGPMVMVGSPKERGSRDRVSKGFSMTSLVARLARH